MASGTMLQHALAMTKSSLTYVLTCFNMYKPDSSWNHCFKTYTTEDNHKKKCLTQWETKLKFERQKKINFPQQLTDQLGCGKVVKAAW